MQVRNVLHAARWKHRTQKSRQKSPSGHHRTNLSGCIFATTALIDNRKKTFKQQYFSTCPHNMVNFGILAAEIGWPVWGIPANFNSFRVLQRYCTASSSGRQPNFAALNRGHHLYLAEWPSRWALAHISSFNLCFLKHIFLILNKNAFTPLHITFEIRIWNTFN